MATTGTDLTAALPDVTGTLRLKGLEDEVEIYRDRYGIAHVRAQSVHDAFFGQGFATAQDRLWHMDYDRRRAYGRWAEFAGEVGLKQDLMMRRFQIAPGVEADHAAICADAKGMLDAYAQGVNAFIESTSSLPVEYELVAGHPEPWRPWDCLAVFKVRHIMMGTFEGKLWRARLVAALGPEKTAAIVRGYQPGHLLIVPPGAEYDGPPLDGLEELRNGADAADWARRTAQGAEAAGGFRDIDGGSNSWVLAGSRTASGKPFLAGDPHRALDTPNVYYQNHIACPEFDAIGLSFPGCPGFPHFGHNAHVAWCVTHAGADYQDLYLERFRPENGSLSYEFKGEWRRADVRHELIEVRGGSAVEIDLAVTHHGPVVAGEPADGTAVSFRYTSTAEPNLGSQCLLDMLKATTADEMDESMRDWVDPCNNFMFADVQGNIGYLNRGKVPIRAMANAWLPVPGWTGEHEWKGYIPFEELARSRHPETGYIVTANNRIVGHEYPHYIALDFAPEYRARRIVERLKEMQNATLEDMRSVHSERVSIPAQAYLALLARIDPPDEPSARAKEILSGWDGSMERELVAPTIYSAFRQRLQQAIVGPLLGPLADDALKAQGRGAPNHLRQLASLLVRMARDGDASLLPAGFDWRSLAAQALREGLADLRGRLGDDMNTWQWGSLHHTAPRHTLSASFPEVAPLLDPPSVPMGGDGDTPQAGSYSAAAPFTMTGMSVARYVFDLSDWSSSAWVIPLGVSGHPGSPHYADQASTWGDLQYIPMLYDWDRVPAEAESRQKLSPA